MTDFRALCVRMADELDHYRQLLMDDRRATHALATEARAALAQLEPQGPTDGELTLVYACAVAAAIGNKQGPFKTEEAEAAQLAGLRAILARWGRPVVEPMPGAKGE
jgi:hypothetical protein